ncbi:hypothetical protein OO009_04665 [Flavobacteriaceae bacterium KMM 6897]|nr:hypothetical protein [Flavobacteriaceae bacterium KMM 6897]
MEDVINIEYCYIKGMEALENKEYKLAAEYFKSCWETYEYTDEIMSLDTVEDYASDAFEKYNMLVEKYLGENGFDRIEYEC